MNKTNSKKIFTAEETLFRQTFAKITDEEIRLSPDRKEEMLHNILTKLDTTTED